MRDLTDVAARFLVFCDPERDAGAGRAGVVAWASLLAPVRVHLVAERGSTSATHTTPTSCCSTPQGAFRARLGAASPGAVLLGTDRMLAGGPVAGADEIADLVEAVAAELGVAGPPT